MFVTVAPSPLPNVAASCTRAERARSAIANRAIMLSKSAKSFLGMIQILLLALARRPGTWGGQEYSLDCGNQALDYHIVS